MKLRTIVKIAITSSVVLLCSGFALYSFFRLSAAEGQKDFNLYELVPSTTLAVFVTDDVLEFVAEVDELTCSKKSAISLCIQTLFLSETEPLRPFRRYSPRFKPANESNVD